jgi:putative nucleotidyltransferase with HDIG domain
MGREDSVKLVTAYVHDGNLIKHCLATGAIMKAAALQLHEPPFLWEEIGILHDIDYELVQGDMQRHGIEGARILLEHGIDPKTAAIVRQHNHHLQGTGYTRPVEIALQAADSLSGLIIACALVKGGRISEVTPKTVTKKIKDKGFAAGCERDRIALISQIMDVSDFYQCAIAGMLDIKEELGLF